MNGMSAKLPPVRLHPRVTWLARLQAALACGNEAIIRSRDRQQMLDAVCKALTHDNLLQTAWVSAADGSADSTLPIALAGVQPSPKHLQTSAVAIQAQSAHWPLSDKARATHPNYTKAQSGGSPHLAVLPIRIGGHNFGALCLIAAERRMFSAQAKPLLLALATNIGCALDGFAREQVHSHTVSQSREAQRLTQAFIDNLPGTVFLKDGDLRLLKVNRYLAESMGVAPADLIGRNNEQLFPPEFAAAANELDRSVLANGISQTVAQTFHDRHMETRLFVVDTGTNQRLLGGISVDVTDRFHEHLRTQILLDLQESATQIDERTLLTTGLESAERLTHSQIGFLHFVNSDQETLELVTWTGGALRGCTAAYDNHYPISSAGIWADCFHKRGPVVVNNYAAHTDKKGLPAGHAHLERFVSVPVIEGERVCMMLGVGNKTSDYSQTDIDTLQLLGNDLWRIAQRRRVEQSLQQRLRELEAANTKLADLKLHLLQTEKLASIGQLAAGVAHEINNPIGFVRSNLGTLSAYVGGLVEVARAYEATEAALGEAHAACFSTVHALKQQNDHAFVLEELPILIAESQDGIERVRKIVLDLKNFSRAGDTDWQWADLTQGLESTINMVWNQIKYKAELRRDYQPVPQVYCIASQINQVTMNLLVNAAQAIDHKGIITVRTGADATHAWIEVEDTGCGMTQEQVHHVFEPFFTTKPPGQGTGLGLAIAWRVMERHHGHFDIQSTVNQGSRIRVTLPIDHRQTPAATPLVQPTNT